MNPENIITGLDIGSSKTTAVIGQAVPGGAKSAPYLKILGVGQARAVMVSSGLLLPSAGYRLALVRTSRVCADELSRGRQQGSCAGNGLGGHEHSPCWSRA